MSIFRDYLKLPRSIYILFFARIINMIGGFVYPLLAILLTQKLGFVFNFSSSLNRIYQIVIVF